MDNFSASNIESQADEVEALSSIYEDNWSVVDEKTRIFSLKFVGDHKQYAITLTITLPPTYPSDSPPVYEIGAPWLKANEKINLSNELENIYLKNIGDNIIFLWGEKIKEYLQNYKFCGEDIVKPQAKKQKDFAKEENLTSTPEIIHGEPIMDRKSTFQAHLAIIKRQEEIETILSILKQNKKIAHATHNIVAYRFNNTTKNILIQDCDDDGEHAAGGRLLHLLQILDVKNIIVVVSRWYGGIHLGPDRFKHINNVARTLLQNNGYINNKRQSSKKLK